MRSALRGALFIARFDLVQLFRQRETLAWVFVMPALFFYFLGTVTGGHTTIGPSTTKPTPIGVQLPYASQPDDFLVDALVERLKKHNFAPDVYQQPGETASARRLILPPLPDHTQGTFGNWTEALGAGEVLPIEFLPASRGNTADFNQLRLSQAVYSLLLDKIVIQKEGQTLDAASLNEITMRPRKLKIQKTTAGERETPPIGFAQTIPGTMVMFTMMILLTGGSILLINERRAGLLRRLASAPISRGSVVLGKWLGRMGLALVQLAVSMILGVVLFDMDWGQALLPVSLLLLLWAAFNASLSLWLSSIARTEGQMTGMAVIGTMVLAALGGCWWPIEVVPMWMQSLAKWLPTGWAMDGMHQLVHFGHGIESAAMPMILLGTGALLLGYLGAKSFRYE